ncbi:MAG: DMT family transporter [Methanomicrobiales archaeon]|nr:DMT family transporter [Methanomicrobiales archaeon]
MLAALSMPIPLWILPALFGALANALYFFGVKRLVRDVDPFLLGAVTYTAGGVLLLLVSWAAGLPAIAPDFPWAVAGTVALNIVATVLYYRALAVADLSLCIPMLAFTPVFLIAIAYVILGEVPGPAGAAGILLVAGGAYLMHWDEDWATPLAPFAMIVSNPGVMAMAGVALLFAVSSSIDKVVVLTSDPLFGSGMVFLLLGVAFSVLSLARSPHAIRPAGPFPAAALLAVSVVLAIEAFSINLAYTLAIVPYVISVKRLSIVISVVFGILLLGEGDALRRIAGSACMLAGAVVIALLG